MVFPWSGKLKEEKKFYLACCDLGMIPSVRKKKTAKDEEDNPLIRAGNAQEERFTIEANHMHDHRHSSLVPGVRP